MASVPSIGCLLAKNQYYRKASISSVSSDSVNFIDEDKSLQGLPEVAEPNWWFKSFFYSEPVLPNVIRKDLSASGTNCWLRQSDSTCWGATHVNNTLQHAGCSRWLFSIVKRQKTCLRSQQPPLKSEIFFTTKTITISVISFMKILEKHGFRNMCPCNEYSNVVDFLLSMLYFQNKEKIIF